MQANQNEEMQRATAIKALSTAADAKESDFYSLSTQSLLTAFKRLNFNAIAAKAVESPFNERATFLLSPLMADDCTVYLFKPCDSCEPYTVTTNATGTVGVYVATQELYDAALSYLKYIYRSKPHDEDHECVLWEVEAKGICGKCRVNEYCHCD